MRRETRSCRKSKVETGRDWMVSAFDAQIYFDFISETPIEDPSLLMRLLEFVSERLRTYIY